VRALGLLYAGKTKLRRQYHMAVSDKRCRMAKLTRQTRLGWCRAAGNPGHAGVWRVVSANRPSRGDVRANITVITAATAPRGRPRGDFRFRQGGVNALFGFGGKALSKTNWPNRAGPRCWNPVLGGRCQPSENMHALTVEARAGPPGPSMQSADGGGSRGR